MGLPQRRGHAIRTLVVILVLLLVAGPGVAATTSWKCGSACKYTQSRVKYTPSVGSVYVVDAHHIWGSTASGTCDPTNDGIRWRIEKAEVWVDGVRVTNKGPYLYETNCQIDNFPPPGPGYWVVNVGVAYEDASTAYGKHLVFHDHACAECDFTDTIIHYLPVQ